MVAEAERSGRIAAAVHHIRQGGARIWRWVAFADKLLQPVLPHRCRVAVSQCSKIGNVAKSPPQRKADFCKSAILSRYASGRGTEFSTLYGCLDRGMWPSGEWKKPRAERRPELSFKDAPSPRFPGNPAFLYANVKSRSNTRFGFFDGFQPGGAAKGRPTPSTNAEAPEKNSLREHFMPYETTWLWITPPCRDRRP